MSTEFERPMSHQPLTMCPLCTGRMSPGDIAWCSEHAPTVEELSSIPHKARSARTWSEAALVIGTITLCGVLGALLLGCAEELPAGGSGGVSYAECEYTRVGSDPTLACMVDQMVPVECELHYPHRTYDGGTPPQPDGWICRSVIDGGPSYRCDQAPLDRDRPVALACRITRR